jgi:hypothetical protein
VRALHVAIAAAAALVVGVSSAGSRGDAAAAGAAGESCTFAVLRRDGVIVPFASYDNGRWSNRWPEPGRRLEIPISIESSPKSWWLRDVPVASWTAWPVQGEARTIRVRNPVNLTVQCERHIGLQSDYSSIAPPVPSDMQPHPKDGLATTGDVPVEHIELIGATSPDWAHVLAAIKDPFAASETKAVQRAGRFAVQDPLRRAQFPVELEVLFKSPGAKPGTSVLYFEAVRRFGRRPQGNVMMTVAPDRRPLTYGAGWVSVSAAGTVAMLGPLTVEVSDNERENLLYVLPLGTFRLGEHRFWAVQRAGWGYERYEILEPVEPEPRVTFKTAGGSCR